MANLKKYFKNIFKIFWYHMPQWIRRTCAILFGLCYDYFSQKNTKNRKITFWHTLQGWYAHCVTSHYSHHFNYLEVPCLILLSLVDWRVDCQVKTQLAKFHRDFNIGVWDLSPPLPSPQYSSTHNSQIPLTKAGIWQLTIFISNI